MQLIIKNQKRCLGMEGKATLTDINEIIAERVFEIDKIAKFDPNNRKRTISMKQTKQLGPFGV